jgi:hypothetical protein
MAYNSFHLLLPSDQMDYGEQEQRHARNEVILAKLQSQPPTCMELYHYEASQPSTSQTTDDAQQTCHINMLIETAPAPCKLRSSQVAPITVSVCFEHVTPKHTEQDTTLTIQHTVHSMLYRNIT